MGFGRREITSTSRKTDAESSASIWPARPPVDYISKLRGRSGSKNTGSTGSIIIASVLGFACAILVFGPVGERVVAAVSQLVSSDLGSNLPGRAADRSPALDAVINACLPSLPPSRRAMAASEIFDQRLNRLGGTGARKVHSLGNIDNGKTRNFAAYLNCAMDTNLSRLCARANRSDLATELTYYFRQVRADDLLAKRMGRHGTRHKEVAHEVGAVRRVMAGQSSHVVVTSTTSGLTSQSGGADPDVIRRMRDLFAQGYLTSSDFGWIMPAEISQRLSDVRFQVSACS